MLGDPFGALAPPLGPLPLGGLGGLPAFPLGLLGGQPLLLDPARLGLRGEPGRLGGVPLGAPREFRLGLGLALPLGGIGRSPQGSQASGRRRLHLDAEGLGRRQRLPRRPVAQPGTLPARQPVALGVPGDRRRQCGDVVGLGGPAEATQIVGEVGQRRHQHLLRLRPGHRQRAQQIDQAPPQAQTQSRRTDGQDAVGRVAVQPEQRLAEPVQHRRRQLRRPFQQLQGQRLVPLHGAQGELDGRLRPAGRPAGVGRRPVQVDGQELAVVGPAGHRGVDAGVGRGDVPRGESGPRPDQQRPGDRPRGERGVQLEPAQLVAQAEDGGDHLAGLRVQPRRRLDQGQVHQCGDRSDGVRAGGVGADRAVLGQGPGGQGDRLLGVGGRLGPGVPGKPMRGQPDQRVGHPAEPGGIAARPVAQSLHLGGESAGLLGEGVAGLVHGLLSRRTE